MSLKFIWLVGASDVLRAVYWQRVRTDSRRQAQLKVRSTDTNGAAVPGVTVKVTSPNLISAQTATTMTSGNYQIANLPPGRYTVLS